MQIKDSWKEKGYVDEPIAEDIDIKAEIRRMCEEKNAVILAHYYTDGAVQDIADFVGDSLALAQWSAKTDADTQNWGGKWRMPTREEWTELLYNCYWKWVDSYNDSGVAGYIGYVAKSPSDKGMVTQGYNGYYPASLYSAYLDTHIFLPAAGVYSCSSSSEVNKGRYWSSSLRRQNNRGSSILFCFEVHDTGKRIDDKALHLFVTSEERYYGQSVRAVCE